jgi:hypothetical protein
MEKLLWASSVWMKVSTKARLCSNCPKRRRAFSTLGGVCGEQGVSEGVVGVALWEMRSGQAWGAAHIRLLEHWVGLNAREENAHGVGPVVQERDLNTIHVVRQLVNVCLQLCKS